MPDFVLPTTDDWDRLSQVVRIVEGDNIPPGPPPPPPGYQDIIVEVTGEAVDITTTTSTTSSTTSSTSSTSSTSGTTTTTSNDVPKRLYPGKVVYRRFESLADQHWWRQESGDCYIEEVNGLPLEIGSQYPGNYIGDYGGKGVFGVQASSAAGDVELCQVTGGAIVQDALEFYPAIVKRLDKNGAGVGIIGWITTISVWLCQRYNLPLSVGFCAMAKRTPPDSGIITLTLSSSTRRVYQTSDIEWCPPSPTTTTSTTSTTTSSTSSSSTSSSGTGAPVTTPDPGED